MLVCGSLLRPRAPGEQRTATRVDEERAALPAELPARAPASWDGAEERATEDTAEPPNAEEVSCTDKPRLRWRGHRQEEGGEDGATSICAEEGGEDGAPSICAEDGREDGATSICVEDGGEDSATSICAEEGGEDGATSTCVEENGVTGLCSEEGGATSQMVELSHAGDVSCTDRKSVV